MAVSPLELEDLERERRNSIIRGLVRALDERLPGEAPHSANVAVYASATAAQIIEDPGELLAIRYAAELHDVGKLPPIDEPDAKHPLSGAEVLKQYSFLASSAESVRHHHERWNGSGHPDGLTGWQIPFGARVIAVAEAFDAMTLPWGWREPMSEEAALTELIEQAGVLFDPQVVGAFLRVQPVIQPLGM